MMKPRFAAMGALVLLASMCAEGRPCRAQETSRNSSPAESLAYDPAREITLTGSVSGLLPQGASGAISGAHLLLTTLSGTVDVSLGRFALVGSGALSIAPGQQAQITGMMKMFGGKPVFLARTVRVSDRDYAIRNQHGLPIAPQARNRATQIQETR